MANTVHGNSRLKTAVQRAWLDRGWPARLMWPVSWVHGHVVRARRSLFQAGILRSEAVSVPVIVVGNVVAGGAGKTPLVMALVRHFQGRGLRVGVVSRGYGRASQACQEVLADTPVSQSGDEPALIRRATGAPVFVANRRVEAARALLLAHPGTQVLVCDDGLQHYALARDIEIAVFDDKGVGNGWLLPAGPLREPWPERLHSGIKLVLHTGQTPAFDGYTSTRRLADHAVDAQGQQLALSSLHGQALVAVAAIANPEAFFSMLRARGLRLSQTISRPDHDDFADFELQAAPATTVLCTEKDALKLFSLPSMAGLRVLAVPLEFSPEPGFLAAVDELLAPLLSQLPSHHGYKTA